MPLTRTIIAPLSPAVIRVLRAHNQYFAEMLSVAEGGWRNLMVLRRVMAIDWDRTFAGKTESHNGRFLYYDYDTGVVTGIPAVTHRGVTCSAVEPIYFPGQERTSNATTVQAEWNVWARA